jgi:hypothetical protein
MLGVVSAEFRRLCRQRIAGYQANLLVSRLVMLLVSYECRNREDSSTPRDQHSTREIGNHTGYKGSKSTVHLERPDKTASNLNTTPSSLTQNRTSMAHLNSTAPPSHLSYLILDILQIMYHSWHSIVLWVTAVGSGA